MYWTDGAKRRYSLARSAGTTVYTTARSAGTPWCETPIAVWLREAPVPQQSIGPTAVLTNALTRRQAVHLSRELWLILSLVPLNDKTLCYPSLLLHPVVVSEVPRI